MFFIIKKIDSNICAFLKTKFKKNHLKINELDIITDLKTLFRTYLKFPVNHYNLKPYDFLNLSHLCK